MKTRILNAALVLWWAAMAAGVGAYLWAVPS
jgi:hypothetical protein